MPVKLVVPGFGKAVTNLGGIESLGPPVGAIIWPQPEINTWKFVMKKKANKRKRSLRMLKVQSYAFPDLK